MPIRPLISSLPIRSALIQSFSFMMMSIFASAAATQTGLPVCVLVIEPAGYWSIRSFRPMMALIGSELEMPLPKQTRSGTMP